MDQIKVKKYAYKILVIDDEVDILDIISSELMDYGFTVLCAKSGTEAIEVLKHNTDIDVVISDFRMPNGDGRFVLDYLNSMENKPVFYFFSAQADITFEEASAKGVQKIYSKPSYLNLLLEDVKNFKAFKANDNLIK